MDKYGHLRKENRSVFDIGQVDAPCTHFMDFSDFYVLPSSPLPPAWSMSENALRRSSADGQPWSSMVNVFNDVFVVVFLLLFLQLKHPFVPFMASLLYYNILYRY